MATFKLSFCRLGVCALLFAPFSVVSAEDGLDALRLSGYGTLGMTWDTRRDMSPIRDVSQLPRDIDPPRAGFATDPTWRLDSRLGVQVDYRVSQSVEVVSQLVLRDHVNSNLENSFESAYIGLRPTPPLDVRLGRLGYDTFLMSDTRNLGYSYSWVRPPIEFYGWMPIFSVNGVDAAYTFGDESAKWRVKAQAGHSRFTAPMGTAKFEFYTRDLRSLTLSRQSGPWRIKGGLSSFTINGEAAPLAPLQAGLGQLSAAVANIAPQISADAADIRRHMSFKNAKVDFAMLGASYDDGKWLAQSEIGRTQSSADIVPHGNMGYASLGRRFGDWTPYAVYSRVRPDHGLRTPSTDWGLVGQAAFQAQALYVLNTTRMSQDTISLGLRWDFHNQMAAKLQWDSTKVNASGYGLWFRDLPLNSSDTRVNMLTLSLDFLF